MIDEVKTIPHGHYSLIKKLINNDIINKNYKLKKPITDFKIYNSDDFYENEEYDNEKGL